MKIHYCEGYKYQLAEPVEIQTTIIGERLIDNYFELRPDGMLLVRAGYAWDGASGPTFDSKSSMRASLVHDVFCQVMRDKRLDFDRWQDTVNALFKAHCIEDGMWGWRAFAWHAAVEFADAGNPNQGPDRRVLEAP